MDDDLDLSMQPRCEACGTVMHVVDGGYLCRACGHMVDIPWIEHPGDGDNEVTAGPWG